MNDEEADLEKKEDASKGNPKHVLIVQERFNKVNMRPDSNNINPIDRFVKPLFTKRVEYNFAGHQPSYTEPLKSYSLQNRGVSLTDSDLDELAYILMGEVGNRGPEKQDLEARVIINTALNRLNEYASGGKKKTLADVLRMPNQYQGYMPDNPESQYSKAKSGKMDELTKSKFQFIRSVVDSLKQGKFEDNTNGAFYYVHNPDGSIEYDDSRPLISRK